MNMLSLLNDVEEGLASFGAIVFAWRGFSDEVEQDSYGAFISIAVEKDRSSFHNALGGLPHKSVRPWVHRDDSAISPLMH